MTGTGARTFSRTHPWLRFELDLRRFTEEVWVLLGEARSKIQHLAGVPLRPQTAQRLHHLYLAKGILATTAIEGNTLSQEQVERHLQHGLELPPSKEYLKREIDNVALACRTIWRNVEAGQSVTLDREMICSFNRILLAGLELSEEVKPGEVRRHNVGVARYRGAPFEDCEYLLDRLSVWLEELSKNAPEFLGPIAVAIIRAIVAHLYLAWIHPFGDGNGRTARMVEFAILLQAGVPTPAAHLLSNHYNETRSDYYRQLDHASRSNGDVIPFMRYAVRGLVDGLQLQIDDAREDQLEVAWANYVYSRFGDEPSAPQMRRRRLVLDISKAERPFPVSHIRLASPQTAEAYQGKTSKTIARDLKELVDMDLVRVEDGHVRARKEIVLAFLPRTKDGSPAAPRIGAARARKRKVGPQARPSGRGLTPSPSGPLNA
jgi:Fic family protein